MAATGNTKEILKSIYRKFPEETNDFVMDVFQQNLKIEAKILCSGKSESSFKISAATDLTKVSFEKQEEELKIKAPFLHRAVMAVAVNPRSNQYKKKTLQTCIPGIMNAVSSLLFNRNRLMNANAFVNSCILRRGNAQKMVFNRFRSINLCLSYSSILNKQSELGNTYDETVKDWALTLKNDCSGLKDSLQACLLVNNLPIHMENDIVQISAESNDVATEWDISNLSINEDESEMEQLIEMFQKFSFQENVDVKPIYEKKFMLVGDNVDIKVKRRHYTKDRSNIDWHLFHSIAVCITPVCR